MEIKITGLKCVRDPKPNRRGDTIIAYFDCTVDFLTMEGAALVRMATNGKVTLFEPLAPGDKPYRRCMQMNGPARWAVAECALQMYEQFS